jgi:hypothetical protein
MCGRYVLQIQCSLHIVHVLKILEKILVYKWGIVILHHEKLCAA